MTDLEFEQWASAPDAIRCVLVEAAALVAGVETTRYMSNTGYVTGPSDAPANVNYEACITGGVNVSESLPLSGRANVGWGDIEISNHDGRRDAWLEDVWSSRPITILVGDVRWPRADFRVVFSGVVQDVTSRNTNTLNLLLRDKSQQLNTALTEAMLSNDTLTKDVLKPLCFGEVHNITPVLVDAGLLTYMVHDGPIEQIIEVRDNGIPVDFGVNLSAGTFSLSASPVGTITASVQGAKFDGQYTDRVADLVRNIALRYGVTPLTAAEVDDAQLAAFGAEHAQHVGVYLQNRANQLDVMQQLAASVGAQVVFSTDGRLQMKKVGLPAQVPAGAREFTPSEMVQQTLAVAQTPEVEPAVRLAYCRNYTVQQNLTTGLPASHAELYGQEWLVVQVSDPAVAEVWKKSVTPDDVQTLLQVRTEAEQEATRRLGLWSTRRLVLKFDSFGGQVMTELGALVALYHDRYGLSSGKVGQVIGKKTDWLGQKVSFEVLV